jgi:hypothetical protein
MHGAEARWVEAVPVHEEHEGQTVWSGIVHVFDLTGHPKATRAYAWAELVDEVSGRQRFIAVLRLPPVETPADAVRVSILQDYRDAHGGEDG